MSLTGRRFGSYEAGSPLGAGGMGEVYRARDARLGRDVALEILPEPFMYDAERLARFERDARVLAANVKISPEGVVKVLAFGLAKGTDSADAADGSRILFDRVRENSDIVLIELPSRF